MKNLSLVVLCVFSISAQAAPLYYSFEGLVSGFTSYNAGITLDDYDVVPGQTTVSYVFEVDFERDDNSFQNSAASWQYFYNDLLSGEIINGERAETNRGYNGFFNASANQGALSGGSRVNIWTSDAITSLWQVQDWQIGQQLGLIDGGYYSAAPGGAVYFFGEVELTSISSINPLPLPGAFMLFVSALGLLGFRIRSKR